jgi:hypothetical protein
VAGVVGGLRAARGVAHSGQRLVGGGGAGQPEAQRAGRVGEPAVVRGPEVQHVGASAEQVEDVLVAGDHVGGGRGVGGEVAVHVVEEFGEFTCAWAGGHHAVLVVAEFGQHELQVSFGLMFADLGEQLGLGAAWAGGVSLGCDDADVLERDLGCEQPAGPVSQLVGKRAAQHAHVHDAFGDRGEPEPLPGGAVDPVPELPVAHLEREPAEYQAVVGVAGQLFGQGDGVVDFFDDDPLVVGAAQRLPL